MSIKLMTKAWDSPAKGNDKLVLLSMCDYANDDGECFPSKNTIAKKTNASISTVKLIMNAYLDIGMWSIEKRKRENGSTSSNIYKLDVHKLETFNYEEYQKAYQNRRKYNKKIVTTEEVKSEEVKSEEVPTNEPKPTKQTRKTDRNFKKLLILLKDKVPMAYKKKIFDMSLDDRRKESNENRDLAYASYIEILKTNTAENIINLYLSHIEDKEQNGQSNYVKAIDNFLLSFSIMKIELSKTDEVKPLAIEYLNGTIEEYDTGRDITWMVEKNGIKSVESKYHIVGKPKLNEELKRRGII